MGCGCVLGALLVRPALAQDAHDYQHYPELSPDAQIVQVLGELKRTLKDPYSIRDFVFCEPLKIKWQDGKPVRWAVMLSFNARNSYGGYAGVQMYSALFRNGRLSGGVTSAQFGSSEGLEGLINNAIARKMANCPFIPDDKIQQMLSPGASIYREPH